MPEPKLLFERDGAVATLTLNRPAVLNVLDYELGGLVKAALEECAENLRDGSDAPTREVERSRQVPQRYVGGA